MTKVAKVDVKSSVEENGDVFHELTFSNGAKRTVHIKADHALVAKFIEHGSKAKLLAAANSAKDVEDAVAKVDAIHAAFKAGKWSLINEGDGQPKVGILAQALAALKPCSLEEAQAHVETLDRATQAKLRASPRVAAKIVEINSKKAQPEEVDSSLDSFLGAASA